MEERLQYLLDRAEISDTVTRYFMSLDRFDAEGVRACLADEFTLEAGPLAPPATPKPRDEYVEEVIARAWGFVGSIHMNPNHLIEIDGDNAHVSAYMWAAHVLSPEPSDSIWGYGIYEIDLIRSGDGWRLSRQELVPVRMEGGNVPEMFRLAAERQAAGKGH